MIPLSYNVRSLAVRKTTTVATLVGIALVVFVLSSVMMLSCGIKKTLGSSGRMDNAIVLRQGSDAELSSNIEEATVGLMLSKDQVLKSASGTSGLGMGEVVVVATIDKLGTTGVSNVTIRGVTENVYEFRPQATLIAGRKARPGTDEVVVGRAIRGRFKDVELDHTFELKKNRPVKVVGIFEDGGSSFESEVWADIDTVRSAYGRQGLVSSVRVRLASPSKLEAFKADVESDKRLGLSVQREDVFFEKQSEGMSVFISALGLMITFFFSIGAIIGAAITMYAQVSNRTREIGTLRALGFSRTSILFSFLIESMILALSGGLLGTILALGMKLVRFSMINFASWSEIVFSFEPRLDIMVASMVVAGGMGFLGGFFPAIRASRVSPVQAMRD